MASLFITHNVKQLRLFAIFLIFLEKPLAEVNLY